MLFFFFQAEDGIRDHCVTGVQTCALPMARLQSTDDVLLSVIVAAYNEAATIEATLRQLKHVPLRVEVIAVNDASTDGTGTILDGLAHSGLVQRVLHQPTCRRFGAVLST